MKLTIPLISITALLGLSGYLGYRLYVQKSAIPDQLSGLLGTESTNQDTPDENQVYFFHDVYFLTLDEKTKTILLRGFAADYTSPRMLKSDALYFRAVRAANKTGCPCGWIQNILAVEPNINEQIACEKMLKYCDDTVTSSKSVNLEAMRNNALGCCFTV